MNNTVAKVIFKIGAEYRNPGLFQHVERLQKSDFFSKEELKSIQSDKLSSLLEFAAQHSKFYKELISGSSINNPWEIWKSLPIIDKPFLLENIDAINCYHKFKKLIKSETSGSTGQPFQFYKNLEWDTLNRASFIRSYSWYDVQPWERNGYFWGYSLKQGEVRKTHFLDTLQNRFRAFNFDKGDLKKFLAKMNDATYLHGYSSMIYEVAQIALELGFAPRDFSKLKMIKGTSEKIYDYYQSPVKEAFGHNIISEYGSAEGGIIAYECPHGSMHVNEENVIVEEINGNAIVTNLNAHSLPIIRYNTGDAIKLDAKTKCTCGRDSSIITEVLGRVGKKIVGRTQHYPSLTLYYIFKNISLQKGVDIQYQAIQREKGKLELRTTRELTADEKVWIGEQIDMYFKTDIDFCIIENQQIHDKKGKLKDFITEID